MMTKDERSSSKETDGSEGSLDDGTLPGSSPSKRGFSILGLVPRILVVCGISNKRGMCLNFK